MKTSLRKLAVVLLIALAAAGCKREQKTDGAASTETIAPAQTQSAPTDTADLTQTVNVEGGRSEAEGAALTDPDQPVQTDTAATGTTTTTVTTGTPATTTTR